MDKNKGTRGGKKPSLRLVTGGTAGEAPSSVEPVARKPKTRGPILRHIGVTAKEEAFAQAVAGGASQSEAFRRSHEAQDMKAETVHSQAVRLASRERVRNRIDLLMQQREGAGLQDRRKALVWALERLQREAESALTDGARVQAVGLVMRHHALLTDKQEVEVADSRSAAEVQEELERRLALLLGRAATG